MSIQDKNESKFLPKDFKWVKIFKDDLQEIENIIKKDIKPAEYKVETDKYKSDGLEEIFSKPTDIKKLEFSSYSPYFSINFRSDSASIYGDDENIKVLGAAYKISQILEKRERKKLSFFVNWSMGISMVLWLIVWIIFLRFENKLWAWILLISFPFIFLWSMLPIITWNKQTKILKSNSYDKINFFTRNKDQLVIVIITALLTGFLTFSITWYFKK